MNRVLHHATTHMSKIIAAVVVFVFAFVLIIASQVQAASPDVGSGTLVTIHDRGESTVVLSNAKTIGEALREAAIEIDESDVVEPAVNQEMVASEYDVNIYRARPVIIVDGSVRQRVMTPYQTAEQIAKSANVTLYPEDIATIERSDDIVAGGAGLELHIDRATAFSFQLYGKKSTARTQGATVGDMLKEKGISLGENDGVSPSQDTPISTDMTVTVWRDGKQTTTVEEEIPFETKEIQDANQPVGYSAIQTAGKTGKKDVTYQIEIRDGKEVKRTEIASLVTEKPVAQVEIVGTKSPVVPYTGGGNKTEWLLAAGIPESDWGYVDYIISHESGWNPNAVNPTSGACGLAQALPCDKVPGNPLNPVDSLKWANGYAHTCVSYRMYCGWEGAYNFWVANRWW